MLSSFRNTRFDRYLVLGSWLVVGTATLPFGCAGRSEGSPQTDGSPDGFVGHGDAAEGIRYSQGDGSTPYPHGDGGGPRGGGAGITGSADGTFTMTGDGGGPRPVDGFPEGHSGGRDGFNGFDGHGDGGPRGGTGASDGFDGSDGTSGQGGDWGDGAPEGDGTEWSDGAPDGSPG